MSGIIQDINHSRYHSAVIDLLGRGYLLWQSYLDLKSLVKSILALSFSEMENTSCVKAARSTISQLASYQPNTFMLVLKEDMMTSKKLKDRENGLWLIGSIAKHVSIIMIM
jgi:hypothetical protein